MQKMLNQCVAVTRDILPGHHKKSKYGNTDSCFQWSIPFNFVFVNVILHNSVIFVLGHTAHPYSCPMEVTISKHAIMFLSSLQSLSCSHIYKQMFVSV